MKAFTWAIDRRHGRGRLLTEGIIVTSGRGNADPAVSLGTKPTACLALCSNPKHAPDIEDGRVYDAAITGGMPQLARSGGSDDGRSVLVRVRTKHLRESPGDGDWEVMAGGPRLAICGVGRSARSARWFDGLFVLHRGDVLRIRPQGGSRRYALWMHEEDGPRTGSWAAFAVRHPELAGAKAATDLAGDRVA
jgi:hypothetical protein